MHVLTDTSNIFAPVQIGTYANVREAEAALEARGLYILVSEEDADNPSHYDIAAYRESGDVRLFTVEPA